MINNFSKRNISNPEGFAVLLSVLILAAIGVAISTSLLILSVAGTQTSSILQESQQAKGLANACLETGLQKLVTSSSYLGTGSLTLGQGSCIYNVVQTTSSLDTINATGTVNTTIRKVEAKIAIPSLIISSWQEVGDFN